MHPEHLACVLVEEALRDAGGLELSKRLRVGLEGTRGLAEREALLLCLGL